jgi:hypothetical protein
LEDQATRSLKGLEATDFFIAPDTPKTHSYVDQLREEPRLDARVLDSASSLTIKPGEWVIVKHTIDGQPTSTVARVEDSTTLFSLFAPLTDLNFCWAPDIHPSAWFTAYVLGLFILSVAFISFQPESPFTVEKLGL